MWTVYVLAASVFEPEEELLEEAVRSLRHPMKITEAESNPTVAMETLFMRNVWQLRVAEARGKSSVLAGPNPELQGRIVALDTLLLDQRSPFFVREFVGGDEDDIDDVPDANAAAGNEFQDSEPYMAQIKPIDAEAPEKDGEEERDEPIFALSWWCCGSLALSFSPIHSVFTNTVIVCTPG